MGPSPLVTVLMPVFRGGGYLRGAIESVLIQSFGSFEFLIVLDGSDDETRSVAREYEAVDRRVRVIAQPRRMGLGWSLHYGVLEARGEWIARMDGDDEAHPDRLRLQLERIARSPSVDILGSQALEMDESGAVLGERRVPTDHASIRRMLPYANPMIHPTVVFRRAAVLNVGSYDPRLRSLEDYDLWFRCMASGLRFENLDVPLLRYRVGRNYYRKKGWHYRRTELFVRLRGCRRLKCSPKEYTGVILPLALLVLGIVPVRIGGYAHMLARRVDPRLRGQRGTPTC